MRVQTKSAGIQAIINPSLQPRMMEWNIWRNENGRDNLKQVARISGKN
jgi:hypothetical protein